MKKKEALRHGQFLASLTGVPTCVWARAGAWHFTLPGYPIAGGRLLVTCVPKGKQEQATEGAA